MSKVDTNNLVIVAVLGEAGGRGGGRGKRGKHFAEKKKRLL